jgi:hypothetical protein
MLVASQQLILQSIIASQQGLQRNANIIVSQQDLHACAACCGEFKNKTLRFKTIRYIPTFLMRKTSFMPSPHLAAQAWQLKALRSSAKKYTLLPSQSTYDANSHDGSGMQGLSRCIKAYSVKKNAP